MNNEENLFNSNILPGDSNSDPTIAPLLGEENATLGIEGTEGLYTDPILREAASLSPIESESSSIPQPLALDFAPRPDTSQSEIDTFTGTGVKPEAATVDTASTLETGVISVPETETEQITATFAIVNREASYNNELGLFRVDDATGRIGDLTPAGSGYAVAALAPERRLAVLANKNDAVTAQIDGGGFIGAYLIQNGTSDKFLSKNATNQPKKKPLAFFSFADINPDGLDHLQSSSNGNGAIELAWEDFTGGGDRDFNDIVATVSFNTEATTPLIAQSHYAIQAEGKVIIKGNSDFDGEILDVNDDAFIYAGTGFEIKGNSILPVQRDAAGEPLLDAEGRQQLIENAVVVSSDFTKAEAKGVDYSGLVPPQIVEAQTVDIPAYSNTVAAELDNRLSDGTEAVIFNAQQNKINNAADWQSKFPLEGTAENPTLVRVTGDKLEIPNQVNLSNYVIIVEQGDIKFKGSQNNLDNVVLLAENGKIDAKKINATDTALLASDQIEIKSNSQFTGSNLIANGSGKIKFQSEVVTVDEADSLTVIAADDLEFTGASAVRGKFLTAADLTVKGDSTFYGSLSAKGDITFQGNSTVIALNQTQPVPTVTIDSVSLTEGNLEKRIATVNVSLSNPSTEFVKVDFATLDGSATSADYTELSGTLSFAPGETSKTIEIEVKGDNVAELEEAFSVRLSNAEGAVIEQDTGTVTISDNDPTPEIGINSLAVDETDTENKQVTLLVELSNPSSQTITVDYATADDLSRDGDTAIEGEDYQAASGTLTFEPGSTKKTITLTIAADTVDELDEVLAVNLTNPTNAIVSQDTGIVTIIDNDIPTLTVELAGDTGVNNTDNITATPSVTGVIDNVSGSDLTLQASFSGEENLVDLSDALQPDGSFNLNLERLKTINGGSFDDGTYTLSLTATNNLTGDRISRELTFTFDTTSPELSLLTPLVAAEHSNTARLIGELTEAATIEYSLDGGETNSFNVEETGNFDQALAEMTPGSHTVLLIATDNAGNETSQSISFTVGDDFFTPDNTKGWGVKNQTMVILGEQDSFVTQTAIPVALGLEINEEGEKVGTRTISFALDTRLDTTDTATAIEDQLLVYLVDPANPSQTLLDNGTAGTAVFSIAGKQTDFTPGLVSFDGTKVTIDATSLQEQSEGLLVFQLLNQDSDTGSIVKVNNLSSTTDPEGTANPLFPAQTQLASPGDALNLANLNPSNEVTVQVNNVRFDTESGEYQAQIQVENNGEPLGRNVAVVFDNLPEGVELTDASGTDSGGNPYLNFRPAIRPGGLDTGAVSDVIEVTLNNPNLERFSLTTKVLVGGANAAPSFEPIGNLTVMPGAKLEIPLTASDPDGDNVTFRLQSEADLPTGMLAGDGTLKFNPKPEEIGSYEFTIIATDGVEEVAQTVTLEVVADSITTTRISGVIENVSQQPLAGVVIELGELQTTTNADGSFTLETDQPLTDDTLKVRGEGIEGDKVYPFIAEKLPLVLGQEVYEEFNNVIDRPIYLPALDVASGQVIDPDVDTTVTTENIPGAEVFVEAGSLTTQEGEAFTGTLSITEVPNDLTPAALPENLSPDMVVTIQPGEMVFNTPAPLSLPNLSGYEAGTEMDLWSINPETGDFDKVGTGRVSDDGSVVETIEGGIRNSSWHFFTPPPEEQRPPEAEIRNEDNKCPDCKAKGGFTSEVEFHSGAVIETHDLVSYQANGTARGLSLTYDSLRADPRQIIHFGYDDVNGSNLDPATRLIAQLTIIGNNGFEYQGTGRSGRAYGLTGGGVHSWSIPRQNGDLSVGLQADTDKLPSGLYNYSINSGFYVQANGRFTGSTTEEISDFVHVNSVDSAFGSGWGIAGWQELVKNSDGSILLIDGDGSELLFEAPNNGRNYKSPPGDFSTLEKLSDGTFKRTLKDQTVYVFNSDNQLESVTDRNGNQTQYLYNAEQQLTKIVDSVGLETVFTYNDAGLVSTIIDPGNRTTQLEYDEAGNLIRITDPDDTARTWSYDSYHRMVGETDQRGNQEQAVYDQFGRAKYAILKDGSKVRVAPLQTQGLYSPYATTYSSPKAFIEQKPPTVSYADGNNNMLVAKVDKAGQLVSSLDGQGNLPAVKRNQQNLITTETNARGFDTSFAYDERGNVIETAQEVTTARNSGNLFSSSFTNIQDDTFFPDYLLSEDLNKDGLYDFVISKQNGTAIYVLLNSGDGTYLSEMKYDLGERIFSQPILEDFNNDGLLDLGTNHQQSIKVMFNQGNGLFSLDNPNLIDLNLSNDTGFIFDFTTEDFNQDGLLDIVSNNYKFGKLTGISWFINQGDSTFSPSQDFEFNKILPSIPSHIKRSGHINVADFNQDGWLDLALNQPDSIVNDSIQRGGAIDILFGQENGTFNDGGSYTVSSSKKISFTTIGDLNNDNQEDLIVLTTADYSNTNFNTYGHINILLNQGDGTFAAPVAYSVLETDEPRPTSIDLGDFNNDGNLDILNSNTATDKGSSILFGKGDGTFATPVERTETLRINAVVSGHFDDDKWLDFAVQHPFHGISITHNQGGGIFEERLETKLSNITNAFALGNFNSDRFADNIVVSDLRKKVVNLIGQEDGTFDLQEEYNLRSFPYDITLGDFNGDGIEDVATVNGNFYSSTEVEVVVLKGNGDGTFSEPNYYEYETFKAASSDNILAEDINKDGLSDILIYNSDSASFFSILLAQQDGTFAPEIKINTDSPTDLNLVDLDGDDNLDVIAGRKRRNQFYVHFGNGDGSFAPAVYYPLSFSFKNLTVGDINNDGQQDVLAVEDLSNQIFAVLNTGNRSFNSEIEQDFNITLANLTRSPHIQLEDVDNDDLLDIAAITNRSLFLAFGNGDGTFTPDKKYFAGYFPKHFVLEDLDENSSLDLVSLSSSGATNDLISVQLNQLEDLSDISSPSINIFERQYTYDPIFNQLTSFTDELGRSTVNDIDPNNGNLLSTTRIVGEAGGEDDVTTSYTYTDAGLVDTMTDSLGRITDYEYDQYGRTIKVISAKGTADEATVSYEYDAAGNQTAIIDENGNRTEFEYDDLNRVIKVTEADPDGDGELTNPVTTFTYDESGNLIATVDANQNVTQHEYDQVNRQTKTRDAHGAETEFKYDSSGNIAEVTDAQGRTSQNIYDSRDRLSQSIDPLGNRTKYKYDLDDNLVTAIDGLGNVTNHVYDTRNRLLRTIDAEGNVTNYEYDAADNLIATVDANDNRTEFEYDELDRQVKQVNALGDEITTAYDEVGNVTSTTDELGRTTNLAYDHRDRLKTTTNAEGGVASYEYDAVGNLTSVTDEENRTTNFQYDALNRQTSVRDALDNVTTSEYDGVGNLTSVTDANDHTTSYAYDPLNRQIGVTNALGDTFNTKYDAVGNVTAVTDELGRTTTFGYDERDLQTSVTNALGNTTTTEYDEVGNVEAVTDAKGNITSYEYDKLYRLIKEIDANNGSVNYQYDPIGNLLGFSDELNRTTSYGYDALNRRVTITDPLDNTTTTEYDAVGNISSITDANNHTTSFTYDQLNRQVGVTDAKGQTTASTYDGVGNLLTFRDELNRTTSYGYDALNRQTSVSDPLNYKTTLNYDAVGNLTSSTDANNHTTSYSYDPLNRLTDVTNPLGDTFSTEYDAVGNITAVNDELGRTTSFGYDERNLQTAVTNALGNTTTTEYDEVGNVKSVTDARGNTTSYEYDRLNRQQIITNALGDQVTTEYDGVDNVTAITDELGRKTNYTYDERDLPTSIIDPLGHTTTSEYDAVGNLISTTDANNHTTSYEYDELDRQVGITDALGQTSSFTYNAVDNLTAATDELNRTTTYTYDQLDRQLSVSDPLNQTTTNTYDPVGNLLSVTDPLNLATNYEYDELDRQVSETNANNETTAYTYDPVGNQLSITDPEQNTTTYTYDALNRQLTDTNQLGDTRSQQYDEVGNVVKTNDRNGREIAYNYDQLNRNTSEIWLDENNNPLRTFNFEYDAASQLTNASDPDSAYNYEYDQDGRLTSVDNNGTTGVPNVVFNYTFDPVDNLTQVQDSIDGVAKGVEDFTYDELDRVTSITQSGEGVSEKRVDLSYDAASQMTGMTRYSDNAGTELVADSDYTYDDAGRLTNLNHDSNGNVLSAYQWAYDRANRITQATSPDGVSDYNYDKTDQLVDASHSYQENEAYSYDDNGNRTNDGYVTGENNRLLSDGTYNYEYDAEGNRTKRTEIATGEVTEYAWDYRNRLVDVVTKDSGGNVIANADYTYDVFDKRIAKSVDADGAGAGEAVVERFVYDGDEIALTFDGEGNQTERFLHGTSVDQILAQENTGGEVLWALADHQGSVRVLMDNQGNVVNQISYDAFGNVTAQTNVDTNFRFGYTGRELDPETGNYNYRTRFYDPFTGRFIQEDKIGFAGGDSNVYRYVGNNPLFYVDPFGYCGVKFSFEEDIKLKPYGENEQPEIKIPFPGDDRTEVALSPAIPFIWKGLEIGIPAIFEYYRRQNDKDKEQGDENTSLEQLERYLEAEKNYDETTTKTAPKEFDPNYDIYTPKSDPLEKQRVEKFPSGSDFLGKDKYTFPDGVEDLFEPFNEINIDDDDIWSELDEINNPSRKISPEARSISNGHAFPDHQNQFPEVKNREDFGKMIDDIINNPSESKENLRNGRKAYWNDATGTVVIVDPGDADGGTAFKPENGKDFFEGLE